MSELPGKPEESGFRIDGEFYEFVSPTGMLDPRLIPRVTNMTYPEFLVALDGVRGAEENGPEGFEVMMGMMAVAISRRHPDWDESKIVQLCRSIDAAEVKFVDPAPEDDARPPESTPATSTTSGGSSESTLERSGTSPDATGLHSSDISAV